jgi:hypothetical protein
MPSKTKMKNAAIAARSAALPSIPKELIDLFVTGPMSAEAVNAASLAFKKALMSARWAPSLATTWATRPARTSRKRRATTGTAPVARPC